MAAHPTVHPTQEALRAFALGKLDDSTSSVLMSHLDGCPVCCKIVAALSSDDFLNRFRQAQGRSVTPTPGQSLADSLSSSKPPPIPSQTPIPNLPPELAANQQYEILRELGRGGMGVVYLAQNKLMDRLEVLKVINKKLLDHPEAIERFLREIRSAAKLSHANIVMAYSVVQQGGLLAFAMEYIEGQDLASAVKAQGPLPVVNACYYLQQAALGLQHAFEKGMVHRDIKPQNLILTRKGKKHLVKVLDFGLAKATREKQDDTGLTGEGIMLGTPEYIAPEQSLDAAKADIRADIYSLGCTLYFLLSGSPPFSGSSLGVVLMAHQKQEAKPLNLLRPEVPEELAAVVRKMMAKNPAKRYQTPLEVVQTLTPFINPGATPRPAPELSLGPTTPIAEAVKHPPQPAEVWKSLTEGGGITPLAPRRSGTVRKPKTAAVTILAPPRRARRVNALMAWSGKVFARPSRRALIGGGIGVGVLLLALLGMWIGGVFTAQGKTQDDIEDLTFKDGDAAIPTANLLPEKTEKLAKDAGKPAAPPPRNELKKAETPIAPPSVVERSKIESKELRATPSNNPAPAPAPAPRRQAIELPPEAAAAAKEYQKACADARARLFADFDSAIERWTKWRGAAAVRQKAIDVLKAEKQKFQRAELIPWSEPMRPAVARYFLAKTRAEINAGRVYQKLIAAQLKAKNNEGAAALQATANNLVAVRVVAQWRHFVNGRFNHIVVLYSNFRLDARDGPAMWGYANGVLRFHWPDQRVRGGAIVDTLAVSADGATYVGGNQSGKVKITGAYEE